MLFGFILQHKINKKIYKLRKMTTQQLDILTEEVMTVLTGYFNLVNAVQVGEEEQRMRFIHGLVEYMLTTEVKTAIFMRYKFRKFTAMMIEQIGEFRKLVLVQSNENLMKALDELELYIHDSAVARGGRGVRRLRQTGPHTGIMTKRSNRSKQESIHYLNRYYLNYRKCTNAILQQQEQEQEQQQQQQQEQEQEQEQPLKQDFVIRRRSERLKRKREEEWEGEGSVGKILCL